MKSEGRWLNYSESGTWSEFLAKLGMDVDVYFKPEYIQLYEKPDCAPTCFVYQEYEQLFIHSFLVQGIPQAPGILDISSAYGYGGPLSNSDDRGFILRSHQEFTRQAKDKGIVAAVTKFHPLLKNHLLFPETGQSHRISVCPTVYVDLTIDEPLRWEKIYSHANRKNINKAKRLGLEIIFSKDPKALIPFRSLYEETMKANNADSSYFFNESLFRRLVDNLPKEFVVISAVDGKEIISSMIVLLGRRWAHCHLIGTKRDALTKGTNNLLHHQLILWLKENRFESLHIGGGRGNLEDDPLLKFKKNFSNLTAQFFIGESIIDSDKYSELCRKWEKDKPNSPHKHKVLKYRY